MYLLETDGGKSCSPFVRIPVILIFIAVGLACTSATFFGFLGEFSWFLDLFSHFRVQYFLSISIIALFMLIIRKYKFAVWFGILALINLSTFLPLYFGGQENSDTGNQSCRVMLANVNTHYGNAERVAEAILLYEPDILVLEEVSAKWIEELKEVTTLYKYSEVCPRDDNFGIALFSKIPFEKSEILYIGGAKVPSISAEVKSRYGDFRLIATHPPPPLVPEYWQARNKQLKAIPPIVKQSRIPVLLLGDLNTSPWSYHFKRLIKESELIDSSQGRGVQPTWHSSNVLMRIPVDHCLHSPEILILKKEIGRNVGSDHFPVIIDFAVKSE